MKILRASDHRQMPWKNGGGVTTEIAVAPPLASVADFDWRISMATVAADGPFSRFDGIDRTLTVLSGEGLELAIESAPLVRLSPASKPYPFPGDATASAKLIAGPVTDFNVMTRRGRWTHSVDNLSIDGTLLLPVAADACIIFCRSGQITLGESSVLDAHDAALIDASADTLEISIGGSGEAIIVHLSQTLSAE
ncbi:HutD/Ves family protein [Phyllobacterium chamaecytisi]|uniref:HutD/Ves family protein n=1 Tax=Phyllobacterium chamaecytisi TaxID=2876082 RepID=UPI001CCC4E45|nr:HutD family protein [Phyllobacterium sp. KW56]MBZ9602496.1 HutD family protein [Phyllobacterium sp. KW56]